MPKRFAWQPCALQGCQKMSSPWSRYCAKHAKRIQRHGGPEARALREYELQGYQYIGAGLAQYQEHPAVKAALRLTEELMNYRARYGFGYEIATETLMRALRDAGREPIDVLRRVCEIVAFIRSHPHRYPTVRTEDHALANGLLKLAGPNYVRPPSRVLRHLGGIIRDYLYPFAVNLTRRLEADEEQRRALIAESEKIGELETKQI